MAGKRPTNIRKGDLAEGLGIEMLRPFFAVAPVPRSEDIGVDVICTLLRPAGKSLYAEDSLYIQIKAASVSKIIYQDDEYTWLQNLLLPIFIASVNIKVPQIELFSMQRVFTRGDCSWDKVIIHLKEEEFLSKASKSHEVYLGSPILRWTAANASEDDFCEHAYRVIKTWVEREQRNRLLRNIGRCQEFKWLTNELPKEGANKLNMEQDLKEIFQEIAPFLLPLATSLFRDRRNWDTAKCVLKIMKVAEDYGVDVDSPIKILIWQLSNYVIGAKDAADKQARLAWVQENFVDSEEELR